MCHMFLLNDLADLHFSEGLAVANRLLVLLFLLELENQNLVGATVAKNGCLDGATGQDLAVLKSGLGGQLYCGTDIARQLFDADDVTRSNPVLFSAGF